MDVTDALDAMRDMLSSDYVPGQQKTASPKDTGTEKKANIMGALKGMALPALAGGLAGAGGAAAYDYMERPESPPPAVMQIASFYQAQGMPWEEALEQAYQAYEEYMASGKMASDKTANVFQALKGMAVPALGGAAAGLGGAALYDLTQRAESPPPVVMQIAQYLQQIDPGLSWDEALGHAYEGYEQFEDEGGKMASARGLDEGMAKEARLKDEFAKDIADGLALAKIAFISGMSHEFQHAPMAKRAAREDAPNYREAKGKQRCATCAHFDSGKSYCNKYDFSAQASWTCDGYKSASDKGQSGYVEKKKMPPAQSSMEETKAEPKADTEEKTGSPVKNIPTEWKERTMDAASKADSPREFKKNLKKQDKTYKAKNEKSASGKARDANTIFMAGFLSELEKLTV